MASLLRIESYSAIGNSTGTTLTAPSGIAVGNLLIGMFGSTGASPYTVPSGWTELINADEDNNWGLCVFYRIADSSDVATSTYTGWQSSPCRAMLRISGEMQGSAIAGNTANTFAGGSVSNPGAITPSKADSMILLIASWSDTSRTFDGATIATSPPTFASAFQVQSMGAYSGDRPEVTSTGTATITLSGSTTDGVGAMIVVTPAVSVEINDTVTTSDTISVVRARQILITDSTSLTDSITARTGEIAAASDILSVSDIINIKQILYTNETRNSATFTNEDISLQGSTYTTIGMATGLLAPPTYATEMVLTPGLDPTYTNESRHEAAFIHET